MLDNDTNKGYAVVQAGKDWDRARQSALVDDILGVFTRRSADLLSFEDVQSRLRLTQKNYRGIQDVELDRIRGSVGRYQDFTREFLPRNDSMRQRWQRVDAIAITRGMDPIEVYQVGETYFVLDGNHRVSVAHQSGMETVQAHVWEYVTPAGLSPEADLDEVLIKAEYTDFLNKTKLNELRPEQEIVFTTPGRYREIECQIAMYQQVLEQIDQEPIDYFDAVTAWYDMIYTPSVQIIEERGVLKRYSNRTEADLFIWVWEHHEELRDRGIKSLAQAADEVKASKQPFLTQVWEGITSLFQRNPE
ncbi:MAG: hypothetical protein JXJ17_19415 [Anaerolineae bacterium]|nr:hypothetical protein [Anaerolineae bacterium]